MSTAETTKAKSGHGARVGSALWCEVVEWYYREADLLDTGREREWLEMISPDIVYQMPVRQTVERARGSGFVENTYHLDERFGSLASRVRRNETPFAWAEDPPSRFRHYVSNIRVADVIGEDVHARTNLLIYRTRADQTTPQLLGGERHDILRRGPDGALLLHRRTVLLDLTAIGTHNLAIIF
ncbi:MAG: aromatic-ring-hydroxylating dioxygenase subunit beta [Candidatus Binatia bacterium]